MFSIAHLLKMGNSRDEPAAVDRLDAVAMTAANKDILFSPNDPRVEKRNKPAGIVRFLAGRQYGQCTEASVMWRKLQTLPLPSVAYLGDRIPFPSGFNKIDATYEPTYGDMFDFSGSHSGVISSRPTKSKLSDGSTLYVFKLFDRNWAMTWLSGH